MAKKEPKCIKAQHTGDVCSADWLDLRGIFNHKDLITYDTVVPKCPFPDGNRNM